MNTFKIKTKSNQLNIEYFYSFIEKNKINSNKKLFLTMCKEGCKNYNKKYSCPPFSPSFINLIKKYDGLFIVLFKCNLKDIKSTEYNKVRIANVVLKSRIIKLMRHLENVFKVKFLSTGSCNLCKPCKLKLKKPCAHPDKKRYSLESVGIDCNKLTNDLFNLKLLWYQNKKAPEYTCVICGIPCNKKNIKNIEKEIIKYQKFIN